MRIACARSIWLLRRFESAHFRCTWFILSVTTSTAPSGATAKQHFTPFIYYIQQFTVQCGCAHSIFPFSIRLHFDLSFGLAWLGIDISIDINIGIDIGFGYDFPCCLQFWFWLWSCAHVYVLNICLCVWIDINGRIWCAVATSNWEPFSICIWCHSFFVSFLFFAFFFRCYIAKCTRNTTKAIAQKQQIANGYRIQYDIVTYYIHGSWVPWTRAHTYIVVAARSHYIHVCVIGGAATAIFTAIVTVTVIQLFLFPIHVYIY